MRFALLGSHPDGLAMAWAVSQSGRHEVAGYSGPATGADFLQERGIPVKSVGDMEEVLADPAIEAVIVAGRLADRPMQLRRALQSERHVLCAYPPDDNPNIAYEAAMIQGDTHKVLLALLPDTLHPAMSRLIDTVRGPLGGVRVIAIDCDLPEDALVRPRQSVQKVSFPHWDVLRAI